ncbi:MAG: bifunctional hydroxymethylpyrimidine kinase/phosphomethylpyrimidine kinase [Gemmatimonadetes bacterium]|nr:bifunctional hydroxymethylpyrimidine kinase/phosphomethylpyrimidine kinase [Gemmatimonadota bacterium]NNM05646.1 bifunctional hydroxymethylpyrimidine kinase/phosphomethylpyrimidine kinase [Gemmatimonadota bacterium]
MTARNLPVALTIAGSDSGGGAGIQADLKTFHAFGVFGTSALTAVTAQNTLGVQAIHPIPIDLVRSQIDSVATDLRPDSIKSGMLATAELVETVAQSILDHGLENYVLDPVMVATSGDRLLEEDAEDALRTQLIPLATLVTPNLHEARTLTGLPVDTLEDMRDAAVALVEMGAGAALVKGGHLDEGEVVDLFWDGERETTWRRAKLPARHTHGTGCTLSAAAAAGLALGASLPEAADQAIDFVARAIGTAPGLGQGNGPVNHFVGTTITRGLDQA